jgi:hypothetical protein
MSSMESLRTISYIALVVATITATYFISRI